MRKVKEVLRLKYDCGLSRREIARRCSISRNAVAEYLRRATSAGINWNSVSSQDESQLEGLLYPVKPEINKTPRAAPDFEYTYRELHAYKKYNLTLNQLWLEYKDRNPDGYQYSQYCELYRRWRRKLDYCMRQEHRGGEKLFLDYSDGLPLVDRLTGEIKTTQLFVGVWGASNFTYAEATLSQTLAEWIHSHVHAFEYFQCIPHVLIPDNLRSGVSHACFYEPEINPTYSNLAEHYGCAVLPARPAKPRDKAKVEVGVLISQRWILSVLRKRTFFSLAELNSAIRECLERLNNRSMHKLKKSRRELFEALDQPNALPLPQKAYEYAEWYHARVSFDYHIEIDHHFYSLPYQLLHQNVDVRVTATTVEAFLKGERVAAHARSYVKFDYTTTPEHRPPEHRAYAEWSPARFIQWATRIGEATAKLVEKILASRPYPEQAFRTCMGILRLQREYESKRVEAAARRALKFNACSFRSMRSILSIGLDQRPDPAEQNFGQLSLPLHENIRGPEYYQKFEEEKDA
jgi:transposase